MLYRHPRKPANGRSTAAPAQHDPMPPLSSDELLSSPSDKLPLRACYTPPPGVKLPSVERFDAGVKLSSSDDD